MTDVHVWRCLLDVDDEALSRLAGVLSADELRRARRLRDPLLRSRAVAFHGIRRTVLAGYVGTEPGSLVFVRGRHGKPSLPGSVGQEDVRFSVSRTGALGVVAVARGVELGVDVERIERRRALGPIADALFSADEAAELRLLEEPERVRRFFELWTRKEAHAKALGVGLGVPLNRLGAVSPPWSLHEVPLGAGLVCTVCTADARVRVQVFDHATAASAHRAAAPVA